MTLVYQKIKKKKSVPPSTPYFGSNCDKTEDLHIAYLNPSILPITKEGECYFQKIISTAVRHKTHPIVGQFWTPLLYLPHRTCKLR